MGGTEMKCKLDFVTNSSSVSVVMWGAYLTNSEIQENETLVSKIKELAAKEGLVEDLESGELMYVINEVLPDCLGLDSRSDYNGDGIYIGKSPFSMGEDETLREFKSMIESKLKELGIDRKVSEITESWFDG
jgi:hypothetical protein